MRRLPITLALVLAATTAHAYDLPQAVVDVPTNRDFGYIVAGVDDCYGTTHRVKWKDGKQGVMLTRTTIEAFKQYGSDERAGASEWNTAYALSSWVACKSLVAFYPSMLAYDELDAYQLGYNYAAGVICEKYTHVKYTPDYADAWQRYQAVSDNLTEKDTFETKFRAGGELFNVTTNNETIVSACAKANWVEMSPITVADMERVAAAEREKVLRDSNTAKAEAEIARIDAIKSYSHLTTKNLKVTCEVHQVKDACLALSARQN